MHGHMTCMLHTHARATVARPKFTQHALSPPDTHIITMSEPNGIRKSWQKTTTCAETSVTMDVTSATIYAVLCWQYALHSITLVYSYSLLLMDGCHASTVQMYNDGLWVSELNNVFTSPLWVTESVDNIVLDTLTAATVLLSAIKFYTIWWQRLCNACVWLMCTVILCRKLEGWTMVIRNIVPND